MAAAVAVPVDNADDDEEEDITAGPPVVVNDESVPVPAIVTAALVLVIGMATFDVSRVLCSAAIDDADFKRFKY
jgi:hypothetical protein